MIAQQVISPLETIKARLEETGRQYKQNNAGWIETSCPVQHNHKGGDGNPHSLHFKEITLDTDPDDTTVIFNCHSSGCSRHEIIKALQLKDNDLYSKPDSITGLAAFRHSKAFENALTVHEYARNKMLPDDYLMYELNITEGVYTFHKADGTPFKVKAMATPYYRRDGSQHECLKLRTAMKKEKNFSIHLWTEGDEKHITYGEHKAHEMVEAGFGIIDEGESCTQALWFHGYPALGIPGATHVESHLDPSLVMNVPKLYVIQEKTDQAGQNFPFRVKKHLESAGYKGEILRVPLMTLTGVKDVSDLHIKLWDKTKPRDHERFREEFQKCLDQAKPMDTNTAKGDSDLPEFILKGQMREQVQKSLELLEESNQRNPLLFIYMSAISKVARNEHKEPVIMQIDRAALRNELNSVANFYVAKKVRGSEDDYELKDVPPPKDLADQILALAPSRWPLPALKSIVEAPVLRPDGSILDRPGYDEATQLYYEPGPGMDRCQIPENPTQQDAIAAMSRLKALFADFPFEGRADYANTLALLFTPFVRHAVKKDIQMALIDATNAGTGKGLITIVVSIIATGKPTTPMSAKDSDEEWRKAILTELLQSPRIVIIDNIRGILESAALELMLTGGGINERILGQSKRVKAKNEATWMATGNNLLIGGDLPRRCYRIRLISQTATPEERDDFKISDLEKHVTDNRAEIVSDILTVARAWHVAGKPSTKNVPNLGTFTDWAKTVGGILEFAGIEGFQANRDELRSRNNEEAQECESFLSAWVKTFNNDWKHASDIVAKITKDSSNEIEPPVNLLFETLPKYLKKALADKPKSFEVTLAIWLGKRVQTVYGADGFRIEKEKDSDTKTNKWRVVRGVPVGSPSPTQGKFSTNFSDNSSPVNDIEHGGTNPPKPTVSVDNQAQDKGKFTGGLHKKDIDIQGNLTNYDAALLLVEEMRREYCYPRYAGGDTIFIDGVNADRWVPRIRELKPELVKILRDIA